VFVVGFMWWCGGWRWWFRSFVRLAQGASRPWARRSGLHIAAVRKGDPGALGQGAGVHRSAAPIRFFVAFRVVGVSGRELGDLAALRGVVPDP